MKTLLYASAMALMLLPVSAKADTFQADSFSIINGVNVTIGNINPPAFENVVAGEIKLSGPTGDLLVWCLDIIDHINLPYTYSVNTFTAGDVRPGINPLNASQVRQIASLMLNGVSGIGGALAQAATQLAIWKTEYGAGFSVVGLSGTLLTDFNFALANSAAGGSLDCPTCVLTVLTDAPINPSQAFGMVTVNAVPGPVAGAGIPGAIAAGMFMLGLARRRKNAAA